jgi:hypothetical protein
MRFTKSLMVLMVVLPCLIISGINVQVFADSYGSSFGSSNVSSGFSQQPIRNEYNPLSGPNYPMLQESYFTDDSGNILMIVNVLGEVNKPGQVVVRENADFATILSLAGGTKQSANLKKVLVARKDPDKHGSQSYKIDLKQYFKNGDRASFIALKPNDTIIIPEKRGLSLDLLAKLSGIAIGYSVIK